MVIFVCWKFLKLKMENELIQKNFNSFGFLDSYYSFSNLKEIIINFLE